MIKINLLNRILSVAAIPLFFSCGTNETEEILSSCPLDFSTTVTGTSHNAASHDRATRAGDITTANLQSMGVFAYFTHGDFEESSSTPGFMYNQLVSKQMGGNWTYSPVKYWPNNLNDKVSFFAYAPHNATGVTLCSNTNIGYPYLTYTVPAAEANQTDLLVSVPLLNKNGEELNFTMKHTLAKVNIIVKDGESDDTPKVLDSFTLKAKGKGKLTYTTSGFNWNTDGSPTTTYTISKNNFNVTKGSTTTVASLYLIPDKTNATFSMKYTIHGTIETGGTAPTRTITVTDKMMPEASEWKAGEEVNYTITIKKTGVEIDTDTSNWWEEDTSNNAEIKTYIAGDLKLGDYYYTDGTYSDGGLRAENMTTGICAFANPLSKPETGKTCIGVVFYAGRHPKDDCVYATKAGTSMKEVHGYVVSLTDLGIANDTKGGGWVYYTYGGFEEKEVLYLVGTPTDTDDYRGYSNTLLIEHTAKERGVWDKGIYLPNKVLNNYSPLAPSATSGWYMPSAGQMLDLYKYKAALKVVLDQLGKTLIGSSANNGTYWTSTETGSGTAYKFDRFRLNSGFLNSYWKGGRDATRPVFTF